MLRGNGKITLIGRDRERWNNHFIVRLWTCRIRQIEHAARGNSAVDDAARGLIRLLGWSECQIGHFRQDDVSGRDTVLKYEDEVRGLSALEHAARRLPAHGLRRDRGGGQTEKDEG